MRLSTTARRLACGIATTGVLSLASALPAAAITDPGPPVQQGSATSVREVVVHDEDGSVELAQIGLGVIGGVALASAAVALGARRNGGHLVNRPA